MMAQRRELLTNLSVRRRYFDSSLCGILVPVVGHDHLLCRSFFHVCAGTLYADLSSAGP